MIKLQVETCKFIKIDTPMQVFFCEFWGILRIPFFTELLRWLLQKNLSSLPFRFSSKSLQKTLAINYISYFPCFEKMIHTLFFIKTRKLHFMFTLLRVLGIWFWNVLNLFLIYSGHWIKFDNHTVIQMTTWLV